MNPRTPSRRELILTGMAAALAPMSPRGAAAQEPATMAGVTIENDVSYLAPGREEKLDLYLPAERPRETRSPAVVIIHGGGWKGGDKGAAREINVGTTLARAGYVCASVNYRLAGEKVWPTNLLDCKNAVRYLRKNAARLQVDPDHVGAIGGSAGGHLALMVGFTDRVPALEPTEPYPGIPDRVQAVVDLYGVADFRTLQKTDADGNPTGTRNVDLAWMLGGTPETAPEAWKLASPVEHVSRSSPPVLILHGTRDTTVDRDQSVQLDRKLTEIGVEHQLMLIPGIGHTFDLQTWSRRPLPTDLRPVVTGFFDRHLRPGAGK